MARSAGQRIELSGYVTTGTDNVQLADSLLAGNRVTE